MDIQHYYTPIIDLNLLKIADPHTIIATGELSNSRWVAITGAIQDWSVYVGPLAWSTSRIASEGDKIYANAIFLKAIATPEALANYRD